MASRLLDDALSAQITELFQAQLINPVQLIYFSKQDDCETCDDAQQLLVELAALSDKIHVSIYDIDKNPEIANQYQIQLTPGLVIAGKDKDNYIDYGIRFLGIPSGYEFSSLINTIGLVSKRDSGLKPEIRRELSELKKPIHLKVFVTPT